MTIRSMVFVILACSLTYFLSKQEAPLFLKVDLQRILKEKSLMLAQKELPKEGLEKELIFFQKDVMALLKNIAEKNKAIILTSPTFGDIKDMTDDVIKALGQPS